MPINSRLPQPPVGLHMNATGQTIFTIGVSIPWVVLIVMALRAFAKDRTMTPLLFLTGGLLAIFVEPVVDVLGLCYFPRPNQWVGLEVFGRAIPMFMWPVYSWFVGGQAFLFWRAFRRGMPASRLWKLWLILWAVNVVLESPGLLMHVYTYYGRQPFDFWGLPLWWPAVNASMPIVAAFLVYTLSPHLTGWRLLAIIPIVPMADALTNGAIALPVWTALNTRLGYAATYPAAILTMGMGALVIWAITCGLEDSSAPEPASHAGRLPARA